MEPVWTRNRKALCHFLCENRDIFAWSAKDLPGVPRELAQHSLFVRPDAKPVRQPTRRLSDDRREVVLNELAKLLAAGFIMEVLHPDWISNPVLVEKKKMNRLSSRCGACALTSPI